MLDDRERVQAGWKLTDGERDIGDVGKETGYDKTGEVVMLNNQTSLKTRPRYRECRNSSPVLPCD